MSNASNFFLRILDKNMARVKAAYNAAKSLVISRFISNNARVLHIGTGTDILKYDPHAPRDVILLGDSEESLQIGISFGNDKKIQYAIGMHVTKIFTDFFTDQSTTVYHPTMVVPRRVRLRGVNLVTTFSVLEQCSEITQLEHLCQQIAQSLEPGGIWVGCVTNGTRLLDRCDGNGCYQDTYCNIEMMENSGTYRFTTTKRDCHQTLWTLPTIVRMAEQHGLKLCLQESLLDVLGNAREHEYVNRKLRLQLDDFPPLSLVLFFSFFKPDPAI